MIRYEAHATPQGHTADPDNPVRHAVPQGTDTALCGAHATIPLPNTKADAVLGRTGHWNQAHPRACPECATKLDPNTARWVNASTPADAPDAPDEEAAAKAFDARQAERERERAATPDDAA